MEFNVRICTVVILTGGYIDHIETFTFFGYNRLVADTELVRQYFAETMKAHILDEMYEAYYLDKMNDYFADGYVEWVGGSMTIKWGE